MILINIATYFQSIYVRLKEMNHESQGDSSDPSIKYRVGVVTLKRLGAGLMCF